MYTLSLAKRDYNMGTLTSFTIYRVFDDEWELLLGTANGFYPLLDAHTKQPRRFKNVNSVISTLESIGFGILGLKPL